MSQSHKGLLVTIDGRTSPVSYEDRYLSEAERTKNAFVKFAAFLIVAIGAVFVPILHFVLVPAALLAGALLAFKSFRDTHHYVKIRGQCPSCKSEVIIEQMSTRSSLKDLCQSCRHSLVLKPSPSENAS